MGSHTLRFEIRKDKPNKKGEQPIVAIFPGSQQSKEIQPIGRTVINWYDSHERIWNERPTMKVWQIPSPVILQLPI